MTLDSLETLNDEQLQRIINRAGELLKRHDRERKEKAVADARTILASAGLSLKDVAARGKAGKVPVYRSGHVYQHPAKPELVWKAKGQRPRWLRNLERRGRKAVELASPGVNGVLTASADGVTGDMGQAEAIRPLVLAPEYQA